MNDKHQENGTLSVPLILTLPASNFVAILRPDWLNGTDQTAYSRQNARLGVGSGTDGSSKNRAKKQFESGEATQRNLEG
jgi:hypothetical protein